MASFSQIVTISAKVVAVVGPCASVTAYTCPSSKIARITKAKNLGGSLLYGVTVNSSPVASGAVSNSGISPGSRHRDITDTWLKAGDSVVVYDFYNVHSLSATSHPDGYFISIEEYDI